MRVARVLGQRQRLGVDLCRPSPGSRQLEHLAEPEQRFGARRPFLERREAFEVVDRSRVRVRAARGVAGPTEVLALLPRVAGAPVVVGKQVELELDLLRAVTLDHARGALVERRADREGDALVRDLLRDDVAEQVRLLGLHVERDEIRRAKHVEARRDVARSPRSG